MPENNIARPGNFAGAHDPRDAQLLRRATIDEQIDRTRLDAMLAKYGAATLVEWIADLAREARRPQQ